MSALLSRRSGGGRWLEGAATAALLIGLVTVAGAPHAQGAAPAFGLVFGDAVATPVAL